MSELKKFSEQLEKKIDSLGEKIEELRGKGIDEKVQLDDSYDVQLSLGGVSVKIELNYELYENLLKLLDDEIKNEKELKGMEYNEIKQLFNNEWISKMCDDLDNPNDFVKRNKEDIIVSLLLAIKNSYDLSDPANKRFKRAYDDVYQKRLVELGRVEWKYRG